MSDTTATLIAAGAAVVGVLLGAILGYLLRGRERRQDRRIVAYADVAGSFIRAVNAGVTLQNLHVQLGDAMRTGEHRADVEPLWNEWTEHLWAFEAQCAVVRIVAGPRGREALGQLHEWFGANVTRSAPFERDVTLWGDAAKAGPRKVAEEAQDVVRRFADDVRLDA